MLGNERKKEDRGRKGRGIEEVEGAKTKTVRAAREKVFVCVCVFRQPKVSQCAVWFNDDPLGM